MVDALKTTPVLIKTIFELHSLFPLLKRLLLKERT